MIFGHEDKIEIFKKLVKNNNLSHAYLFYGDSQIGKFLFAKHLAYFLEFGQFEVSEEPLIDTQAFSPNDKNTIGIDDVRELKRFLSQTSFKSGRRLAIIDRAETLTPEAQSSLLKIVEEPGRGAMIIFIVPDAQVLLPPLLSRLTKVYFARFSRDKIEKTLTKHFKLSVERAKIIGLESMGRLGRAIETAEDKKPIAENNNLESTLEKEILNLYRKDPVKNSSILAKLLERAMLLARYNLNPRLQEKVIKYQLANY